MTKKKYDPEIRERVLQLYRDGVSMAEIARQGDTPRDVKTIRTWVAEEGIALRGNPQRYPRAEIMERMAAGETRADLAAEYGCSPKYLSNLALGKLTVPKRTSVKPLKPKKVKKKKSPASSSVKEQRAPIKDKPAKKATAAATSRRAAKKAPTNKPKKVERVAKRSAVKKKKAKKGKKA